MRNKVTLFILLVLLTIPGTLQADKKWKKITEQIKTDVSKAIPKEYAKPAKTRRIVVFSKSFGFVHNSTSVGKEMLKQLSEKTKTFEVIFNDNPAEYTSEYLKQFDAILVNNATQVQKGFQGENREAFLNFIKQGKSFIGIHSASDGGYKEWPEYSEMVGGTFAGHPWHARGKWAMKLMAAKHPVNKPFKDVQFIYQDEIYKHKGPYSKEKMQALIAIDPENDPLKKKVKHDRQYPISWIKKYGEGKVFYTCFGHRPETFWEPRMVDHMLRGIQFALGDIQAEIVLDK